MRIAVPILVLVSFFYSFLWASESPKFNLLFTQTHQVQLLEESAAALEARLQLIEEAEEFIILETFIYDLDTVGSWVAKALVKKKRTHPHVKIRILIDSLPMRKTLNAFHASELEANGIEFKLYNQMTPLGFTELHVRNHIKLLASEKEAITGGRNIANDYYSLASDNNFIDRDIRIRGNAISGFKKIFEIFWASEKSAPPKEIPFPNMEEYRNEHNKMSYEYSLPTIHDDAGDTAKFKMAVADWEKKKRNAFMFVNDSFSTDEDLQKLATIREAGKRALTTEAFYDVNDIRIVSDGPDWVKHTETITGTVMLEEVQKTQKRLVIENGYIIPDSESWKIFKDLMRDKKDIFILTNSRRASRREFVVNALTQAHARNFVFNGAKVWLYAGGAMPEHENPFPEVTAHSRYNTHAKSFVVDGQKCMVGTANFDPRSLRRMNAEMMVMVQDPDFCARIEDRIFHRAKTGHIMDANGDVPPDISTNNFETIPQLLLSMVLPVVRLFERWF